MTQFGLADQAYRTDASLFVSDDGRMHGKINPASTAEAPYQIIWYAPPVCKITDSSGNVLTFDNGSNRQSALFDSLEGAIAAFNTLSFQDRYGVEVEPSQIQMLITSYTINSDTPKLLKNAVITTAAAGPNEDDYPENATSSRCTIMRGRTSASMLTVGAAVELAVQNLVLDGGNQLAAPLSASGDGGVIYASTGSSVYLGINATLRNSTCTGRGGAVYLAGGAELTMQRESVIENCSAANGGGVYAASGSKLAMQDIAAITGCQASGNGGAAFIYDYASVELSGNPAISANSCSGNGAGFYLASTTSTISLRDRPNFSDNVADIADFTGKTNGGEAYLSPLQDIYLKSSVDPVKSIVISGNLSLNPGSIWVWAETSNHYANDTQFATIGTGVVVDDSTLEVFRDARDDETAGNDTGQYFTGVRGANASYVYWGNGCDVFFKKTDSNGYALGGATFTLYRDYDCTIPVNVKSENISTTTVPSTGTFDDETGCNVAFRAPNGVFYLKEVAAAEGYANNGNTYRVVVGRSRMASLGLDTSREFAIQQMNGPNAVSEAPDIAEHGILNNPQGTHRVILRKIDDVFAPLEGATFDILRYDRTVAASGVVSYTNGAFWIGELPYGTYYLHETGYPDGTATNGSAGWWYVLAIDENGASVSAQASSEPQ